MSHCSLLIVFLYVIVFILVICFFFFLFLFFMFSFFFFFFFSSRRRHTRSTRDWSSDVCSSDLHCPGFCSVFRDGNVSHADNPREVLGAGVVSNPTISIADCGRRAGSRSEERRVGKECRSRWSTDD